MSKTARRYEELASVIAGVSLYELTRASDVNLIVVISFLSDSA